MVGCSQVGYRLNAIATDSRVLMDPAYRDHNVGEPVKFPVCLARFEPRQPGFYRVVDGRYRSIQVVRNGEREIPLCVIAG